MIKKSITLGDVGSMTDRRKQPVGCFMEKDYCTGLC